jgi:replicative DNA helicase
MKLVSQILERSNVDAPLRRGISPEILKSSVLAQTMFSYVCGYKLKHSVVPSLDVIYEKFSEYEHVVPEEPISVICDFIIDNNLSKRLNDNVVDIMSEVDNNPRRVVEKLGRLSGDLSRLTIREDDISICGYAETFSSEYERFKASNGMVGYPFPWKTMNKITGGMAPQNLIVLYGSGKSCKSWLLLYITTTLYIEQQRKVLVVTKEMSPEELARRCIAIIGRLPYTEFKSGNLIPQDEERVFKLLSELDNTGDIIISDARADDGIVSVASIMSKIETVAPDVVMVDGAYLIDNTRTSEKDPERVTRITRELKELAQRTNIPIAMTSQANRYGDRRTKSGSIGFSVSLIQDADILMSIFRNMDTNEIAIKVDACREGLEQGFTINAIVARDFTEKSDTIVDLDKFIIADTRGVSEKYIHKKEEQTPGEFVGAISMKEVEEVSSKFAPKEINILGIE